MVFPDIGTFRHLSAKGNVIPVYREILADMDTPVSAFLKLGARPAFLLESVEGGEKWARYSFLGISASKIVRAFGNKIDIIDPSGNATETRNEDPFAFIRAFMSGYKPVHVEGLPRFNGGLVGFASYDTVRFIEDIPDMGRPHEGAPDMFFMLTDSMLVFDSLKQTIKVVTNVHLDGIDPDKAYASAITKIDEIARKLRTLAVFPSAKPNAEAKALDFVSSFGHKKKFEGAVTKAKEYIKAGDVIQVVLSQRFESPCPTDAFSIYRALRVINPSPYMYFIDTGEVQLVGSSPEILVRLEEGNITLRPIAGTRGRGKSEDEDRALAEELKADPKEIAEHIMLVDLGRNDVGKVAETGSVHVTDLMSIERYSHVMHMVSNVQGRLKAGLDSIDVLRACFPAGTVTGAPKVRAMEIIEELEPVRRGPYAGAVGYFSFSGNMDTCITIRTIIVKGNTLHIQAGAGIVADSVPENEYKETLKKARGMMRAVEMARDGLE